MQSYRILLNGGQGELVEKKSRFIATVRPVSTEEEAIAFIDEMKKKYWDAKHNCSAYVIGEHCEITRCSDDGEPSGTAGRPMLEVLLKEELHNTAVVVTRYFGGVLLGTGGLVRAYSQSVKEGLAQCETGTLRKGQKWKITVPYNELGKVKNYLEAHNIEPDGTEYLENVLISVTFPANESELHRAELVERCAGKLTLSDEGDCVYLDKNL